MRRARSGMWIGGSRPQVDACAWNAENGPALPFDEVRGRGKLRLRRQNARDVTAAELDVGGKVEPCTPWEPFALTTPGMPHVSRQGHMAYSEELEARSAPCSPRRRISA